MSQILGAFKQSADKYTCDLHLWPVRFFSCFRSDQPNSRISTSATHYVSQILGNNPFCLVTPAFDWYLPVSYMYKKSTSLTRACLNLEEVFCRWSLFRKLHQVCILLHDVNHYPEYLRCEVSTFYCNIKPFTVSH